MKRKFYRKKPGCLVYFLSLIFLVVLIFNINFYSSDDFKIPALGKKYTGTVKDIDSTKANYQNYNFTYIVVVKELKNKRVRIDDISKSSQIKKLETVRFSSFNGKHAFTFSAFSIIVILLFGVSQIATGYFLIRLLNNK